MIIRKFEVNDAEAVSLLITRNFLEVNIKDYTDKKMKALANEYKADKVIQIASYAHTYVACEDEKIIGTGSISSFWGSKTESILLTLFVLPELHHQGIGEHIIQTLESDELFLRANRIEIPASITACKFYEKMGYSYKNNKKELDEEGHYRMEKYK